MTNELDLQQLSIDLLASKQPTYGMQLEGDKLKVSLPEHRIVEVDIKGKDHVDVYIDVLYKALNREPPVA